jgi:D-alanine-D-alanine ligase
MARARRVVLLIDSVCQVEGDPGLETRRAYRHAPMEHYLARAMRELSYEVTVLPCRGGRQLVNELASMKPDVVFNATEDLYGRHVGDVHVAAMLEGLRVAYTGATPSALLLCRDKAASKGLAAAVGVRVPMFAMVPMGNASGGALPPFPLVVKPAGRDSSVGVGVASYVQNARGLASRIGVIHRRYRDAAIIEQFIPGVDVNVFVVEGRRLQIGAPTKRFVSSAPAASPRSMVTYHAKHNNPYRAKWRIRARPLQLSARATRTLHRDIQRLWPALKLRDYGRFDFRMNDDEELYFLEANANPGFSPMSRTEFWKWPEYVAAVRTVVENAVRRGGR